ncbi:MAG: hypothetical protein J6R00_03005, partial [Lentisphaeria bacterium]|nr:hypothetical protein [Lentisphaeria bacterium]
YIIFEEKECSVFCKADHCKRGCGIFASLQICIGGCSTWHPPSHKAAEDKMAVCGKFAVNTPTANLHRWMQYEAISRFAVSTQGSVPLYTTEATEPQGTRLPVMRRRGSSF